MEAKDETATEGLQELQSMKKEIALLKESINEMKNTMNELCALCAASLVASGTKLQERFTGSKHSEGKEEGNEREQEDNTGKSPGKEPSSMKKQATGLSSKEKQKITAAEHVQNKKTMALSKENEGEWQIATNKRKNKTKKQKKRGAVIIGGPNVRRVAFASWERHESEKSVVFEPIPDGTTFDVLSSMNTVIEQCEAESIDLVVQIGEEDILRHHPDYVVEGIAAIIQEGTANGKVKEVTVCSVVEKYDLEKPGYGTVSYLNESLKGMCAVEGARFLDLRPALRACKFNGLNRTEYLYTAEGARSISKILEDEIQGFFM